MTEKGVRDRRRALLLVVFKVKGIRISLQTRGSEEMGSDDEER